MKGALKRIFGDKINFQGDGYENINYQTRGIYLNI